MQVLDHVPGVCAFLSLHLPGSQPLWRIDRGGVHCRGYVLVPKKNGQAQEAVAEEAGPDRVQAKQEERCKGQAEEGHPRERRRRGWGGLAQKVATKGILVLHTS